MLDLFIEPILYTADDTNLIAKLKRLEKAGLSIKYEINVYGKPTIRR